MILEFIQNIEGFDKGSTHIEHPEDLVFTNGYKGANGAFQALNAVIAQPKNVTIKWDGYPALIFGRNHDGQLLVVDKHMFNKKDGSGRNATSVEKFIAYDQARNVNRGDLYQQLAKLWPQFEAAVPQNARGYYWGDLLWTGRPVIRNGEYTFQPNTVQYHIPVTSDLGQRISKSGGGIIVHQYFSDFDSPAQVLTGTGELNISGSMCIMTSAMNDNVVLRSPVQLEKQAAAAIKAYGAAVDALIDPINLASIKCTNLPQLMKTYINSKVRGETRSFYDWVPEKLSGPKLQRLIGDGNSGYLHQNSEGVDGAMAIHAAMAAVKNSIVQQLDAQQKTIKATVNNKLGGEGYVVNSPIGLIKLVNRALFSAANFAKNM